MLLTGSNQDMARLWPRSLWRFSRDDLWLFPQAVLKLVWDSRGPSLGSKLILAALGCSRTSRKESTGASPALPGSLRRLILLQLRLAWGLAPVTSV